MNIEVKGYREFSDQFGVFEDENYRIDPIDPIDPKIHDIKLKKQKS